VAISCRGQQLNLDLHAKRTVLSKYGISGQIFIEVPCIKFHENPSSRSRADIFGGQKDGWTDITNIVGAFRDFARSPLKAISSLSRSSNRCCHSKICETFLNYNHAYTPA